MPKKKITLTSREEQFVQDIVDGFTTLEAYRRNWENSYNDSKARSMAKGTLNKEHVQEYLNQLLLDRQDSVKVDEEFVIEQLKRVVRERPGTTQAVQALKQLGQYLGMFVERQVVESNVTQREISEDIWERRQAIERGEDVKPFVEKEDKHEAEIIEFEIKDGTDG